MNKGQSNLICNHINNCFCSFNVKLSMLQFVFIPSLIIMNTATHCLWALYCETGTRQTREITYWSCWQWDGDRNWLGVPQGLVLRYFSFKFKLKFCPRTNFGIIYCFVGKLTYLERIVEYGPFSIGLFNTPCFLYKILNKYCFQRFLGVIVALSRNY